MLVKEWGRREGEARLDFILQAYWQAADAVRYKRLSVTPLAWPK